MSEGRAKGVREEGGVTQPGQPGRPEGEWGRTPGVGKKRMTHGRLKSQKGKEQGRGGCCCERFRTISDNHNKGRKRGKRRKGIGHET